MTYGGSIDTVNDIDAVTLVVQSGAQVDAAITKVGDGCGDHLSASLLNADGNEQQSISVGRDVTGHFQFTPDDAGQYYIELTGSCAGDPYQLRIDPASALLATLPPPDTDGDGIADSSDSCPTVRGVAPNGGPDGDGDAVVDAADQCPNTKGPAPSGCPDTDGDGIIDTADQCVTAKGPAPSGCPDTDGDGVIDTADQCVTVKGPGPGGCPVVVPLTKFGASLTIHRKGHRYYGRLSSDSATCLIGRRVVLRRCGSGNRSLGSG